MVWKVTKYKKNGKKPHIVFTYHSLDGEEGEYKFHFSFHCRHKIILVTLLDLI